ncbi:hypothetical protein COCC4DRAFT_25207 [Bipolaris maydis ATCC 48331]|uniref:Uncharacterized protein n=2 Tax=Cochliobolus heterostrophus TaxID=5016 RepID=M2TJ99_COCH5|nr:uncharacterized protein COCC4DRAFT_25207 [Bipolaris maydis ATCC 48331]EMD86569.1 hypothetical protein COCHEDRAFT_1034379 [Bipolaris maydis C5]KAJ5051197.1 hypothetical protein J3E74DRAFT_295861 [Bipolaris maydis]ENI02984.1 hypothetical protein COCC4DRAFT_25207 [Bipolaris maydis ATCC 48331]KAJ5052672.1 hypothetical protein J3E74DRAFT_295750 [Bipolaris maydis]KAJ6267505.1 hypothetical protein PSV08DRAFT_250647 [Bipolaris maydis]
MPRNGKGCSSRHDLSRKTPRPSKDNKRLIEVLRKQADLVVQHAKETAGQLRARATVAESEADFEAAKLRAEANELEDASLSAEADHAQEFAAMKDTEKVIAKSGKDIKQEERDNEGDFLRDSMEDAEVEYV